MGNKNDKMALSLCLLHSNFYSLCPCWLWVPFACYVISFFLVFFLIIGCYSALTVFLLHCVGLIKATFSQNACGLIKLQARCFTAGSVIGFWSVWVWNHHCCRCVLSKHLINLKHKTLSHFVIEFHLQFAEKWCWAWTSDPNIQLTQFNLMYIAPICIKKLPHDTEHTVYSSSMPNS